MQSAAGAIDLSRACQRSFNKRQLPIKDDPIVPRYPNRGRENESREFQGQGHTVQFIQLFAGIKPDAIRFLRIRTIRRHPCIKDIRYTIMLFKNHQHKHGLSIEDVNSITNRRCFYIYDIGLNLNTSWMEPLTRKKYHHLLIAVAIIHSFNNGFYEAHTSIGQRLKRSAVIGSELHACIQCIRRQTSALTGATVKLW